MQRRPVWVSPVQMPLLKLAAETATVEKKMILLRTYREIGAICIGMSKSQPSLRAIIRENIPT